MKYSLPSGPAPSLAAAERAAKMAQLYRTGHTLEQVGQQFGISHERVRQVLKLYYGFDRTYGGIHVGAEDRAKERKQLQKDKTEARMLRSWGISRAEWKAMVARYGATTRKGSPLRVFKVQRRNMIEHGCPWELTFAQWWAIWQASGKWDVRQQPRRRDSYILCRKNGQGGFFPGNVEIKTLGAAIRDYQRNRPDRVLIWKPQPIQERLANQ